MPQGSVIGRRYIRLYGFYTSDLPSTASATTETSAHNPPFTYNSEHLRITSNKLQNHFNSLQNCVKK